jgi:hypothetical protein
MRSALSHSLCDSGLRPSLFRLLANTESFNDCAIARFIDATQIVEQPAPPSDELQETTP